MHDKALSTTDAARAWDKAAPPEPPPSGGMGMRGMLAQLANASAMMVVCALCFTSTAAERATHAESLAIVKHLLETTVANNTAALRDLTKEVRFLRSERTKGQS